MPLIRPTDSYVKFPENEQQLECDSFLADHFKLLLLSARTDEEKKDRNNRLEKTFLSTNAHEFLPEPDEIRS